MRLRDSGGIAGSVWGGRWSDYELGRLKTANGGKGYPEVSRSVQVFCGQWPLFFWFSLLVNEFLDAIEKYLSWYLGSTAVRPCFWMGM